MQQWALIDPDNQVSSMSNSWEALQEMVEGFADRGESWKIVPADVRFWCEHPELTEAERCGWRLPHAHGGSIPPWSPRRGRAGRSS